MRVWTWGNPAVSLLGTLPDRVMPSCHEGQKCLSGWVCGFCSPCLLYFPQGQGLGLGAWGRVGGACISPFILAIVFLILQEQR